MPSPFPGMDPYLEDPTLWRAVHGRLINAIDEHLSDALPPGFVSTIEERIYMIQSGQPFIPDAAILSRPVPSETASPALTRTVVVADEPLILRMVDEEIIERFIEIRLVGRDEPLVAVIEILSPSNKAREAYGRDIYAKKRDELLLTGAHLLEIDLLRGGLHAVAAPREGIDQRAKRKWDYVTCLHRAGEGRTFHLGPVSVRDPLPSVSVPLTEGIPPVAINLQSCVTQIYRIGKYDQRIDYTLDAIPPLPTDDALWADAILKEAGFR